jgi:FMN reductase
LLGEIAARGLANTRSYDIADTGPYLSNTLSREAATGPLDEVLSAIEAADLLVAATPVYKGSYTGLFKHLFDLLDPKALDGKRIMLAATGGSERHALVIEHQLRPLFAFFGAHVMPVSVYAVNGDFVGSDELASSIKPRILRAVDQLTKFEPHDLSPSVFGLKAVS